MWIYRNPNPARRSTGDCVVRAISIALDQSWEETYDGLCAVGREMYDMPNYDGVWGLYLYRRGARPFMLPDACPECVTVREFCRMYPEGRYIIGTGGHAVAVVDGNWYDSFNSGDEVPSFFWHIRKERI